MLRRMKCRYSLRVGSALLALAGFAATFAWFTDKPRRQQRAIQQTRRLGGIVSHDAEHDPMRPPPQQRQSALWERLRAQLGPEYVHALTLISLNGQPVGDDDLSFLRGLSELQ